MEPPRYEIGFISEYEQIWDLKGYSRGGLVSSLTMAPQEELTIEVFSWDRSRLEDERDQTNETQRSDEATSMARVSSQLSGDLTETTDKKANIGLGAPLPIGPITVDAQGQASVSDALVQSIKSTVDTISESTRKASEQFKSTTQVKVTQTRETGSETRVTRRIRNPNLGRSLTVHCFEVMEHYRNHDAVVTRRQVRPAVEIPQRKTFDIAFVLAQEEKLQHALLSSNFLPGFRRRQKAARAAILRSSFTHQGRNRRGAGQGPRRWSRSGRAADRGRRQAPARKAQPSHQSEPCSADNDAGLLLPAR